MRGVAAEAAHVAKKHRDNAIPTFEQVGMQGQLLGQLGGEELLEAHAGR